MTGIVRARYTLEFKQEPSVLSKEARPPLGGQDLGAFGPIAAQLVEDRGSGSLGAGFARP